MSVPSYRPDDEVTIEAWTSGHRVECTIVFKERVSAADFANIKVAFEAGLREGLLLAERMVSEQAEK